MSDKTLITKLFISLALASSLSLEAIADDALSPLDLSLASSADTNSRFEFTDQRLGGFERKKISKDVRIRGWRINDQLYVGQARVANTWGLGLVYENGDVVYGLNHRGLQIIKRL